MRKFSLLNLIWNDEKKPLNMKFTTAEQDKHALEICRLFLQVFVIKRMPLLEKPV